MKKVITGLVALSVILGVVLFSNNSSNDKDMYSMGSFGRIDHSAPVMKAYQVDDDYVTTLLTDMYGEDYNTGEKFKD